MGQQTTGGSLEVPELDERSEAAAPHSGHLHLTLREIRGLLTKQAQDLVLSVRATAAVAASEEAQPMRFREFIRLMGPAMKMN